MRQRMSNCLTEYRCSSCHKLLFKGLLVEGSVEIKCKHCHAFEVIHATQFNQLLCLIKNCPNRIDWKTPEKSS